MIKLSFEDDTFSSSVVFKDENAEIKDIIRAFAGLLEAHTYIPDYIVQGLEDIASELKTV